jgi:hypothetical protein
VTLEVRHLLHPDAMGFDKVPVEERGALGIVQGVAALRRRGDGGGDRQAQAEAESRVLAVIGLVGCESLPVDVGDPVGPWRALSFLGLGPSLTSSARCISASWPMDESPS